MNTINKLILAIFFMSIITHNDTKCDTPTTEKDIKEIENMSTEELKELCATEFWEKYEAMLFKLSREACEREKQRHMRKAQEREDYWMAHALQKEEDALANANNGTTPISFPPPSL
ncbi:MAG: hypothetical protein WC707_02545 [Candidatus Babeliaceae bacterium]